MIKISIITSLLITSLIPFLALAQSPPSWQEPVANYSDIIGKLRLIAQWMLGILIVVAVIFFIYAAYLYLSAAGDEDKVKKAKDAIIYGVVALVVGLIAMGIPRIVATFVGVNIP